MCAFCCALGLAYLHTTVQMLLSLSLSLFAFAAAVYCYTDHTHVLHAATAMLLLLVHLAVRMCIYITLYTLCVHTLLICCTAEPQALL
jgi:hypothetical protein